VDRQPAAEDASAEHKGHRFGACVLHPVVLHMLVECQVTELHATVLFSYVLLGYYVPGVTGQRQPHLVYGKGWLQEAKASQGGSAGGGGKPEQC
jgi:hypothetical protein